MASWSEKARAASGGLCNFLISSLLFLILQLTHLICFVMVLMPCLCRDTYLCVYFVSLPAHTCTRPHRGTYYVSTGFKKILTRRTEKC